MSSSNLQTGGGSMAAENVEVFDLTPAGISENEALRVNLRDAFGFVGFVSDRALAEIARNENRACRVVMTAATFAFR